VSRRPAAAVLVAGWLVVGVGPAAGATGEVPPSGPGRLWDAFPLEPRPVPAPAPRPRSVGAPFTPPADPRVAGEFPTPVAAVERTGSDGVGHVVPLVVASLVLLTAATIYVGAGRRRLREASRRPTAIRYRDLS
jgi:hypothetical protein